MTPHPITRTWQPPTITQLEGQLVRLTRLDAETDCQQLYDASHGTPDNEIIWRYMFNGPFASQQAMRDWLRSAQPKQDPLFYTIYSRDLGVRVGQAAIMNIVPDMGRAELGSIWYGRAVHKTRVNTESIFLLLRYLFDGLGYRRVEWKCDNRNEPSKRAALRLGFSFEGLFRQHMVIKNQNRDTAWFAMLDGEWPVVKANFERYFASNDLSLTALNKPIVERGASVRLA